MRLLWWRAAVEPPGLPLLGQNSAELAAVIVVVEAASQPGLLRWLLLQGPVAGCHATHWRSASGGAAAASDVAMPGFQIDDCVCGDDAVRQLAVCLSKLVWRRQIVRRLKLAWPCQRHQMLADAVPVTAAALAVDAAVRLYVEGTESSTNRQIGSG